MKDDRPNLRRAAAARLIDFGMRRAHGAEVALYASRASFIAYDCERAAHCVTNLYAEQQRGARFGPIDALRIDYWPLSSMQGCVDAARAPTSHRRRRR